MTTGQANNQSRQFERHLMRLTERHHQRRKEFARLSPSAADRLLSAAIAIGSLGAASPPMDG
jgi:hypothetical protein